MKFFDEENIFFSKEKCFPQAKWFTQSVPTAASSPMLPSLKTKRSHFSCGPCD